MRYSVLGFNQEKLMQIGTLDMSDVLIMDYVQKAISQPSLIKTMKDDQPYVWLQHKKLLEDLPILGIKEDMLKKRISKLVSLGLIQSIIIAKDNNKGSRAYYGITELFESLQFSQDDLNTTEGKKLPLVNVENTVGCKKLPLVDGAGVKNYTSDIKLDLDNKLDTNSIIINNNTISTAERSDNDLQKPKRRVLLTDDVNDKVIEDDKPKRKNLYEKCLDEIDSFTEDAELRIALRKYMQERLHDKTIKGIGQWKGMLRTLSNLNGDKAKIVDHATARGWKSFYELQDYAYNKQTDRYKKFGEHKDMKSVRPEDVEGGQSSGIIF